MLLRVVGHRSGHHEAEQAVTSTASSLFSAFVRSGFSVKLAGSRVE